MTKRTRRIALCAAAAVAVALAVALAVVPRAALGRARVERMLSDYFGRPIRLRSFTLSAWPGVHVEAYRLEVSDTGAADHPLVTVRRLVIDTSLFAAVVRPTRVRLVRFEGLRLHLTAGGDDHDRAAEKPTPEAGTPIVIERVEADGTVLRSCPGSRARRR